RVEAVRRGGKPRVEGDLVPRPRRSLPRKGSRQPFPQGRRARAAHCRSRHAGALIMPSIQPVRVEKPWGYELIWAHTDRYVGKVLHIKQGEALSYQYHRVKDETIRLLSGAMEMDLETDSVKTRINLKPGDCLHIVPGMKHRMIAVGDCDVLEVS